MGAQTNPQLKLNLVDLPTRRFKMNDFCIPLEQGAFLVKNNVYDFSDGFINFLTNQHGLHDNIEEHENKITGFYLIIDMI